MFDDPFVLRTIVIVETGIIAILAIAVILLGIKRNTYYVDENDQPIRPRKKSQSVEARAPKKQLLVEDDEEGDTEVDLQPTTEATTVVPTVTGYADAPVEEGVEQEEDKQVPLDVKPASVTGVKISVDVNGQVNTHIIDQFPCLIGRESGSCNLTIPEPAVSRKHAKFVTKEDKLYIEDVSEHNGTYVNQTKLPSLGKARLYDGDEISLGRVLIRVEEILY